MSKLGHRLKTIGHTVSEETIIAATIVTVAIGLHTVHQLVRIFAKPAQKPKTKTPEGWGVKPVAKEVARAGENILKSFVG